MLMYQAIKAIYKIGVKTRWIKKEPKIIIWNIKMITLKNLVIKILWITQDTWMKWMFKNKEL